MTDRSIESELKDVHKKLNDIEKKQEMMKKLYDLEREQQQKTRDMTQAEAKGQSRASP